MIDVERQLLTIFTTALDHAAGGERAAYLDAVCGADAALRERIEALLRAHAQADAFLERPERDPALADVAAPGATVDHAIAARPGMIIGPYKLLEQIGEGGMGTVWMAQQTEPVKRVVALKLIKAGMDSKQVITRFEAERQALALMDHPNIARVLDAGTTSAGRPYFVMDLVKGVPITEYCDEHHLTPRQRLELFIPVCQAVQHAHQKGIIHRDLKPSNVLVALYDGKPVPKVIDFGVAKAAGQPLTDKTLVTGFGAIVGTLEYMSPEQAEINQLDIDTRSDIYSLGVLLYELLTGSPPFSRKDLEKAGMLEMLRVIREQEPSKPSTKLSTADGLPTLAANRGTEPAKLMKLVRGELDWIVMKALEKDRSRRYETANGFAMDVQRYLADEAVQACPPSLAYRVRKFARRNRGPVLAALAIFLLLAVGVVGTTWGWVQALAEADAKELQRERAEKNAAAAKRQEVEALTQKREAQEQAAIAQAVTDFLNNDVLNQASIFVQESTLEAPPDRDLKVRDALDRAARRIPGRFEKQPLIEAYIRHIIGSAFRHMGDYAKAEEHLAAALRLRRQVRGEQHVETLRTLSVLAMVHFTVGDFAQAEQELQHAIEGQRRTAGEQDEWILYAMRYLALLYRQQGQYAKAEPIFLNLFESRRNTRGAEHPLTLGAMSDLAAHYSHQGKYPEADSLLQQVLERQRKLLGEQHPSTLISLFHLAELYSKQRQFAKAEPLLLQVLEAMRKVFGEQHPQTLNAMNGLAWLYQRHEQHAKAEPLHVQVLEGRRRIFGERHRNTIDTLHALAKLYANQGKYAEAEKRYRELLATQRAVLGEEFADVANWHIADAKSSLGAALSGQGKYEEAEPLLLASYQELQAQPPPPALAGRTREALARIVKLYEDWGKKEEAAQWRAKLSGK